MMSGMAEWENASRSVAHECVDPLFGQGDRPQA
jgi:hypothetical protein